MKTFFFLGDFLLEGETSLNIDDFAENFREADEVICNFEGVMGDGFRAIDKAGPVVCQHSNAARCLVRMGITAVTTCNNHSYDYGEEALNHTEEKLRFAGIRVLGSSRSGSKRPTDFALVDGVAIINACEAHPVLLNGELIDPLPQNEQLFSEKLRDVIAAHKELGSKVIVCVHAGLELVDVPLKLFRQRYRDLIDAGADVVIAHHPHVPQGFEEYSGRPIFYSLGNFMFQRGRKGGEDVNGLVVKLTYNGSEFSYETYSVKVDYAKNNLSLMPHDFLLLNECLSNDASYQKMLKAASRVHANVIEGALPLLHTRSLGSWLKLIFNLTFRPAWLRRRRQLISNLVEINESYKALIREPSCTHKK